ncbi:hypothetical protein [Ruania zhangjianzhongii]|uniref:hypothetical protein n=1 Tax=Ruania zhangjianzhongii TaxID=2603206 RepID=UPI0011CB9EC8|nr:hypothetical protein [Ruania zhangjianzhongii]
MRTRRRLPLLAGAALLAGMVAGGGTFALWNTEATTPANIITNGNLDIEAGDIRWDETSADVASPQTDLDPADFLVRQGDTIQVSYEFTTHLQGDNMLGQIEVDWADAPALPSGVSGSYQLNDSAGAELATAPLGTVVRLDDAAQQLDADDAGRADTYTLTIDLDFADLDDRFGADSAAALADLGTFDVELHQVRTGEGFQ